jgi:DNA repair exonuclease SbcCD ATPase subunit
MAPPPGCPQGGDECGKMRGKMRSKFMDKRFKGQRGGSMECSVGSDQKGGKGHNKDFRNKMFGGRGGEGPLMMIKLDDPQKYEELKKLKDSNPEECSKQIKEFFQAMQKKRQAEREEMKKLKEEYKKTKSESVKAQIKQKLAEEFARKLKMEKARLTHLQEKLKEAEDRYNKREQNSSQIVDSKLNEMLKDPELRW